MWYSQVDLAGKQVLVVMELGETDLNSLMQRHRNPGAEAKSTGTSAPRPGVTFLELNFLRLTWQQMLRAVCTIHDARIVHGDLKPANFVFVKVRGIQQCSLGAHD